MIIISRVLSYFNKKKLLNKLLNGNLIYKPYIINHPELYVFGKNNVFNENLNINGCGKVEIGDNNLFAWNVTLLPQMHDYHKYKGTDSRKTSLSKPIKIGNNNYIGCQTIICGGVEIGDNCVIGAGSVLRGQFPSNSLIIGNPAKIVKKLEN